MTASVLAIPIFRRFWVSTILSTFGAMIQAVGAAWMMASLTGDPQMVALVQTFATLPVMIVSLPAGALADTYDRRRILLFAQTVMLIASAALAAVALLGAATPVALLVVTFVIGAMTALNGPSWQSSVSEIVPRSMIDEAVSMNSVGFNLSRCVGPAVGGLIVAAGGAATAFAINAVSYLPMIATLIGWRRTTAERPLPPERMQQAILSGLRYALLTPELIAVVIRAGVFGLCGSGVWALMAVLARERLGTGAAGYGLLLAGFGGGAMLGALFRSRLPLSREQLARACTALFGCAAIVAGLTHSLIVATAAMVAAGCAWVVFLSSLSAAVQILAPRWVVGRAVALNQVVIFAGMAFGSLIWGIVAARIGIGFAFVASGVLMLVTLILAPFLPISADADADLTPTREHPIDDLEGSVRPDDGPIVMMIEYRVRPERFRAFVEAMEAVGRIRRRDGALRWALQQDLTDPTRWVERFHSATWLDHLRRQVRPTQADQAARDRLAELHEPGQTISRFIERRLSTEPIGLPARLEAETRIDPTEPR
ncbi:MFS transporter [Sphingomonas profundi]|uniref:MFS transporter n=1 Tax=Alterirhizorhabdus profundi TaxID=2681549 RepID=UPI0012E6F34D|nr:MFS transporter [Sphingomonas profundi]